MIRSSKFGVRSFENLELQTSNPPPSSHSRTAILRECSPVVPHVRACECPHADRRTLEVLKCPHCFSAACSSASPALTRNESVERIAAHSYIPVARAWHGTEVVGPMEYLDQDIDLPSLRQDRSSGESRPSYHLCSSKQELLPLYFTG